LGKEDEEDNMTAELSCYLWLKGAPLKMAQPGGSFHVGFADMKTAVGRVATHICQRHMWVAERGGWKRGRGEEEDNVAVKPPHCLWLRRQPRLRKQVRLAGERG
jgi:hypothetical protein